MESLFRKVYWHYNKNVPESGSKKELLQVDQTLEGNYLRIFR